MQEEDTCRICSFPADAEQPLFHPCKCSGTIRYIHQDCLTTWLAHSKKKTCDVCKHQYSFTKVYSPNMPKRIPFILVLRKLAQQMLWACLLGLRAIMVTIIWLAFLPYVTVWTWRFYFIVGENIAWWINDRPRPTPSPVFSSYYASANVTDDQNRTDSGNSTMLGAAVNYPVWRALSSDIFTGQIIASLIVFAFLGVFLLREWIIQNARPGVFEDNAVEHVQEIAEDGRQPVEAHVQPVVEPNPAPAVIQEAAESDGSNAEQTVEVTDIQKIADDDPNSIAEKQEADGFPAALQSPSSSESDMSQDSSGYSLVPRSGSPPTRKRRQHEVRHARYERPDSLGDSRFNARSRQTRRIRTTRPTSSYTRSLSPEQLRSPSDSSSLKPEKEHIADGFKFTFSMEHAAGSSTSSLPASPQASDLTFSFTPLPEEHRHVDFVRTALPYPLTPGPSGTSTPNSSRRPPLPSSIAGPGEQTVGPSALPGFTSSSSAGMEQTVQPLASPSLAMYRAPEDLQPEAGPSQESYFDIETVSTSSTAGNDDPTMDYYFREPSESDDEEDQDDVPEFNVPRLDEAIVPPAAIQEPPVAEEQAQDPNDDLDANVDDDMDGALEEAIGMRGPITTVFQNAALMIFVLDTTIGLGVWLPFTIGKTTALLSLEPIRIIQLVHFPIRAIRLVTDPVVDACFFVARVICLPLVEPILATFAFLSSPLVKFFAQDADLTAPTPTRTTFVDSLKSRMIEVAFSQQQRLNKIFRAPNNGSSTDNAVLRGFDNALDSPVGQFMEPYFATLGKYVRLNSSSLKVHWTELASGDGSINRIFAIALGYVLVFFAIGLYFHIFILGNVQSAGRAIRNAIRQQLVVLKVAMFIVVELFFFPLGCGIMLDLCSRPLFSNSSVSSRVAFFAYAPVTAIFGDWMIGTMFMYQFAVLLSDCRKLMRPGAMWFIKDPQDQNFHPIRDILDRPAMLQLRKLAVSAVMYSVVVACGVGGIVMSLKLWRPAILPLRWSMRHPLSDIPIDLLFLHIVMPSTIRSFRPRKLVRKIADKYWHWAAHELRLTSYMFGNRVQGEEVASPFSIKGVWAALWDRRHTDDKEKAQWEGSFRRVPAVDNISLPKEISMIVPVNVDGSPMDEASKRLIELQNAEALKARRDIKEDYMVVYTPPYFRQRVITFIISLWLAGSLFLVTAFALPIILGRAFFFLALNKEVHDAYSFVAGFYLLWGCFLFGKTLDRLDKRRQRSVSDDPRGEWPVYVFKRGVLWAGKFCWLFFWLGIVIPTLTALVMEVYLVHPLRLIINPDTTLRIRLVDQWALGLVYTKMALTAMRLRPETTRIDAAIRRLREGGWRRPDGLAATTKLIIPVTFGLTTMLVLPMALVVGLRTYLPSVNEKSLFLYFYPGIFIVALVTRVATMLESIAAGWAQSIRDSEFLVEMRLRNLEPVPPVVPVASTSTSSSIGIQSNESPPSSPTSP